MLEQGPGEIRTSLPSRNTGVEKKGKGEPSPAPLRPWGCLPRKGRHAAGLSEASTTIGALALDTGLLRSPAGTNLHGREKRGDWQEGAQLDNKGGPRF